MKRRSLFILISVVVVAIFIVANSSFTTHEEVVVPKFALETTGEAVRIPKSALVKKAADSRGSKASSSQGDSSSVESESSSSTSNDDDSNGNKVVSVPLSTLAPLRDGAGGLAVRDVVQSSHWGPSPDHASEFHKYYPAENAIDGNIGTASRTHGSKGGPTQRWEITFPNTVHSIRCVALYARRGQPAADLSGTRVNFLARDSRQVLFSSPVQRQVDPVVRIPTHGGVDILEVTREDGLPVELAEVQLFENSQCSGSAMNIDFASYLRFKRITEDLDSAVSNVTYHCRNAELLGRQPGTGDGQWPVCLDVPLPSPCTVFSLGSANDFSFDDAISHRGCRVATFDPTLGWPTHRVMRGDRIAKYGIGVTGDRQRARTSGGTYKTLPELMDVAGFERITILKMDVEGHEWEALRDVLEYSKKGLIDQFLFEIHFFPADPTQTQVGEWRNAFRELLEHYELFYHHTNMMSSVTWMPYSSLCCLEVAYIRRDLLREHLPLPARDTKSWRPQHVGNNEAAYVDAKPIDILSPLAGPAINMAFVWQSARWAGEHTFYFQHNNMIDNDLNSYTLTTGNYEWFEIELEQPMQVSADNGDDDLACVKLYNRRDRDFMHFTNMRLVLLDSSRQRVWQSEQLNQGYHGDHVLTVNLIKAGASGSFKYVRLEKNGYLQGAEIQLLSDPTCVVARDLNSNRYLRWMRLNRELTSALTSVHLPSLACADSTPILGVWSVCDLRSITSVVAIGATAGEFVGGLRVSNARNRLPSEASVDLVFVDVTTCGDDIISQLVEAAPRVGQLHLQLTLAAAKEQSPDYTEACLSDVRQLLTAYGVYGYSAADDKVINAPMRSAGLWRVSLRPIVNKGAARSNVDEGH